MIFEQKNDNAQNGDDVVGMLVRRFDPAIRK